MQFLGKFIVIKLIDSEELIIHLFSTGVERFFERNEFNFESSKDVVFCKKSFSFSTVGFWRLTANILFLIFQPGLLISMNLIPKFFASVCLPVSTSLIPSFPVNFFSALPSHSSLDMSIIDY